MSGASITSDPCVRMLTSSLHAIRVSGLLTLSGNNIDDQTLNSRLRETPNKSIILLEDVDAIFVKRDAGQQASGVSFSGLLNAIDGVASQENRVVICTTNHIEQLDPALIRPGRLDRHFKFDFASPTQLRGMVCTGFAPAHFVYSDTSWLHPHELETVPPILPW